MSKKEKDKNIEPVPDEFFNYEEASEFWDTHDTMNYLDIFEDVEIEAEFRGQHYELEVDEDVMKVLKEEAQKNRYFYSSPC